MCCCIWPIRCYCGICYGGWQCPVRGWWPRVFAAHPLHVESVAWVIERKDVLSGLFYLAAVLAWMRFVEKPSRGRYAGSLVLYAAGMLSKSIVVTLPATLLIWRWWKQGRVTAPALKQLVPFFYCGSNLRFGRSVPSISPQGAYLLTSR